VGWEGIIIFFAGVVRLLLVDRTNLNIYNNVEHENIAQNEAKK
jgi:hypothetical protein